MATLISIKSSSTESVGTDLLRESIHRAKGSDRWLASAGLGGGTAAGDSEIKIYIGDQEVGALINSKTSPPTGQELFPFDAFLPAGTELRAIVTDAFPSACYLMIELEDADDELEYVA